MAFVLDAAADVTRAEKKYSFATAGKSGEAYLQSDQVLQDMTALAQQHAADSAFSCLVSQARPATAAAQSASLPADVTTVCELMSVANDNDELLVSSEQMVAHMAVSNQQISALEKATILQRASTLWKAHRLGRITASNFGRVYKWVNNTGKHPNADPKSLTDAICTTSTTQTAAMKHGLACERFAKELYIRKQGKSHKKFIATDCGLILHREAPYLGASPDLHVSCECHAPGLCEIKSPYTIRDEIPTHNNLDYLVQHDNVTRLNRKHSYYFQVQGQMAITDTAYCDFFVYTTCGDHLERIEFDADLWQNMFSDLSMFWHARVAPFMLAQHQTQETDRATSTADHTYVPASEPVATDYVQPVATKRKSQFSGRQKHKFLSVTAGHTNVYLCGVCADDVHESSDLSLECKKCHVRYHYGCVRLYTNSAVSQLVNSSTWHCDKCSH